MQARPMALPEDQIYCGITRVMMRHPIRLHSGEVVELSALLHKVRTEGLGFLCGPVSHPLIRNPYESYRYDQPLKLILDQQYGEQAGRHRDYKKQPLLIALNEILLARAEIQLHHAMNLIEQLKQSDKAATAALVAGPRAMTAMDPIPTWPYHVIAGLLILTAVLSITELLSTSSQDKPSTSLGGQSIYWDNLDTTKSKLDAALMLLSFLIIPIGIPALGLAITRLERYQNAGGLFARRQPEPQQNQATANVPAPAL